MKTFLKIVLGSLGLALIVAAVFYLTGYKYVVPIMMYHHVEDSHYDQANYVTPERFEEHLRFLKDNNYNVISLHELVNQKKAQKPIARKTVVITFDDGYANNYSDAYPLLKKYDFPAIIFVPSDAVGTKGRLTWSQMEEMVDGNIAIGSHTRNEAYLPEQSGEQLYNEIQRSQEILEESLGQKIRYFAYPTGGFTKEVKKVVREAGYRGACTTNRGYDKANKDIFELNRIRFSNNDNSKVILWVKLSGYYNLFRKNKNPY